MCLAAVLSECGSTLLASSAKLTAENLDLSISVVANGQDLVLGAN